MLLDLFLVQLTVSTLSQSHSELSQPFPAAWTTPSTKLGPSNHTAWQYLECAVVWIQCMYILPLLLDIDSDRSLPHSAQYMQCPKLPNSMAKSQPEFNMNSSLPHVVQCASVDILSGFTSKTSLVQSTKQCSVKHQNVIHRLSGC